MEKGQQEVWKLFKATNFTHFEIGTKSEYGQPLQQQLKPKLPKILR
jgi:hypothetical protein